MKFFFKWSHPTEILDPDEVTETDLDILDFSLTQREGEIALCQLTVPLTVQLKSQHYAILFVEIDNKRTLLFKGKLADLPIQINDWQQRIELFALPVDGNEQLETIRDQIQKSPEWDGLFVDPSQRHDPVETLEAIPTLFCWHPVTHRVSLSDLFHGRENACYDTSQILQDSFCVKVTRLPKPHINVSVVAEWLQEAAGEINVFPLIEKKFKSGKINTLTANGLMASWPRAGQLLGRSGYAVVESKLQLTLPESTGVLNLYPQMTEKITFSDESIDGVYLKRSWFTGRLKLGWSYRQRRREIVTFRLNHKSRLLHRADSKKLDIILRLANIAKELPSPSTPSFFETARGKRAVGHALKIARCHLASSARGIEIVFKVPLDQALSLSLDHSIEIHHPSLPGAKAKGKLIEYKLVASFEKVWAQLKVAISTGMGETKLPSMVDLMPETPLEGLPKIEKLDTRYFVEALHVDNQAVEQIEMIQQGVISTIEDLKKLLHNRQTEVVLKLKDIRSVDVLERRFSVTTPLSWGAPDQTQG